MAVETYVNDGTDYRKLKSWYVHDGSDWRDLKKAYCHDGTDWRLVFKKGYWVRVGTLTNPKHIKKIGSYIYAASDTGVWMLYSETWSRIGAISTQCSKLADVSGVIHTSAANDGACYWDGSSWVRLGSDAVYNIAYEEGRLVGAFATRGTPAREWNGTSWANIGTSPTNALGWYGATIIDGDAYVGQYLDGIWKQTGSSWSKTNGGARTGTCVVKISGTLYAGFDSSSGGVFYWSGSTWVKMGSGCWPFHIEEIGGLIYCANFYGTLSGVCYWDGSAWVRLGVGSSSTFAWHVTEIDDTIWAAFDSGVYYWSIPVSEM